MGEFLLLVSLILLFLLLSLFIKEAPFTVAFIMFVILFAIFCIIRQAAKKWQESNVNVNVNSSEDEKDKVIRDLIQTISEKDRIISNGKLEADEVPPEDEVNLNRNTKKRLHILRNVKPKISFNQEEEPNATEVQSDEEVNLNRGIEKRLHILRNVKPNVSFLDDTEAV